MDPLKIYFLLKILIFHCYVSLPEGRYRRATESVACLLSPEKGTCFVTLGGPCYVFRASPFGEARHTHTHTKKVSCGNTLVSMFQFSMCRTSSSKTHETLVTFSIQQHFFFPPSWRHQRMHRSKALGSETDGGRFQ